MQELKCHTKGQQIKFEKKKLLTTASFSHFHMYFWRLLRTYSITAALEHNIKICSLNFNWSSIFMPSNFIEFAVLILLLSTINSRGAWAHFLFRMIAWNSSEFTMILFYNSCILIFDLSPYCWKSFKYDKVVLISCETFLKKRSLKHVINM